MYKIRSITEAGYLKRCSGKNGEDDDFGDRGFAEVFIETSRRKSLEMYSPPAPLESQSSQRSFGFNFLL